MKTKRKIILKKEKEDCKKKNKKNKIILIILLILFSIFIIAIETSFSMYVRAITGKGIAQIAMPILEVRREESILLTASKPKESYSFEIRNYKEEEENNVNISGVDMEYYIEIISNKNKAIKFDLYQEEKLIPLNNNKTSKIKLKKGEKQIHTYRLDISYDKTKDETNKPIDENVEIKIRSIQKT